MNECAMLSSGGKRGSSKPHPLLIVTIIKDDYYNGSSLDEVETTRQLTLDPTSTIMLGG